jgi:hypothetical protein
VRELLEQLVAEMVEKGIRFEDAQREFEKRFITRVMQRSDGNLTRAADTLGVHRNTLTRKIKDLKIRAGEGLGLGAWGLAPPGLKSRRFELRPPTPTPNSYPYSSYLPARRPLTPPPPLPPFPTSYPLAPALLTALRQLSTLSSRQ